VIAVALIQSLQRTCAFSRRLERQRETERERKRERERKSEREKARDAVIGVALF